MIEIKNLKKTFSSHKKEIIAVNTTSLELPNKGFICILGESGSGKTTLLNVLSGLEPFEGGQIYYGDKLLNKYDRKTYEDYRITNFGYIFQNYLLVEDCTVAFNIDIALEMSGLSREERDERIDEVLAAVNMEKYHDKPAGELSGGEKQRVVLARVLAKMPNIIFADEPTANLDKRNAVEVMNLMREISKTRLIIMVSHQRELVYSFADRILHIENGTIVKDEANIPSGIKAVDDDGSIYLDDYPEEICNMGGVDVHFVGEAAEPTRLDIVFLDGKYYLRVADNSPIVAVDNQSDIVLIDSRTPENDSKPKELNLSKPEYKPVTKQYQLIKRICASIAMHMSNKKYFMAAILIINTLLLCLVATAYFTIAKPDISKIVTHDSHYIYVEMDSFIDDRKNTIHEKPKLAYFTEVTSYDENYHVLLNNQQPVYGGDLYSNSDIIFFGKKYTQLQPISKSFSEFTYAIAEDRLDEKDIIEGRLPENDDEIVLDKWVVDRIIHSNDIILKSYEKYEDFIGETVRIDGNAIFPVTIVGICDTKEPNVYISRFTSLKIAEWLSQLDYHDTTFNNYISSFTDTDKRDKAIEEEYDDIMQCAFDYSGSFIIYTQEVDTTLSILDEIVSKATADNYKMNVSYPYQEELEQFQKKYERYLNIILCIGIITGVLSLITVFYLIYADICSQKKLLTIYYVNGVKGQILSKAYMMASFRLVTCTVLPFAILYKIGLACYNALNFLTLKLNLPLHILAGIIILLYVLVSLISFTLIKRFISRPVARQEILE